MFTFQSVIGLVCLANRITGMNQMDSVFKDQSCLPLLPATSYMATLDPACCGSVPSAGIAAYAVAGEVWGGVAFGT